MKKRLFIAAPLPPDLVGVFENFKHEHQELQVRWTAPKNLHLTTYFLGDVDEEKIDALKESIRQNLGGIRPFNLQWKGVLFAPPGRPPRMIWGEFESSPDFTNLVQRYYEACKNFVDPATAEKPHTKPIPHLTLARFQNPDVAKNVTLHQPAITGITMTSCQLMASELTPHGSIYTVLETYEIK